MRMVALGSTGISGKGAALGGGRRVTDGAGPPAGGAVGGGAMTGAATAEEDPACEYRAARRLWAESGERERILGCLCRRGEPVGRRETLREERGARPTTGGEA